MLRQAALNLVTVAATAALLGGIALATVAGSLRSDRPLSFGPRLAFGGAGHDAAPVEPALPSSSSTPYTRLVGVATDPWHVDDWSRAVGRRFDIAMNFYAWSKQHDPTKAFLEAESQGVIPMITWEPWRPVPAALGPERQGAVQARYSNSSIAAGRSDPYIRMFARAVARHPGPVIIRYAHEMNGYWYPWNHDPGAYVKAWRHVVRLFRAEGAHNAVFVWSVNPSLYISDGEQWMQDVRSFWPGARYVDWVGSTMINFGGYKQHTVREYATRIRALRVFDKPLILSEVNVDYADRRTFLPQLRRFLDGSPGIRAVVWSQFPSRGQKTLSRTIPIGNMNWQARRDAFSRRILKAIIADAHHVPMRALRHRPAA